MPCSSSGGQPEVRHGFPGPPEFAIQMTRQVMRQHLGPAPRLVMTTAAAERPSGVELAIEQADTTFDFSAPLPQERLLLGGVLHLQFERVAAVTVIPWRAAASRLAAFGQKALSPSKCPRKVVRIRP